MMPSSGCINKRQHQGLQDHLKTAAVLNVLALGAALAREGSPSALQRWKAMARLQHAWQRHAPMCRQMSLLPALAQSSTAKVLNL